MSSTELASTTAVSEKARKTYLSVIGLASLVVLFQAVWAGLFIQEGQDYKDSWVEVHARGADLAILLAVIATGIAFVRLRARRDLWIGAGVFAVLLVVESYIGGLIGAHSHLTVVHFPIGMALMALSVYLPMRAARG